MAAPALQGEQQKRQKRQKVMVAVDESECGRYALEWALRKLAPVLAPPLLVLIVQPLLPLGYVSAASFGAPPPELITSMQQQQRQLTQALLDKVKAICAGHGVAVETIVEVGDPKELICETAEKSNVDLLIMGSHSRGPVQRLFLGSVSNYCVHHSKCPVLVVKKQGGDWEGTRSSDLAISTSEECPTPLAVHHASDDSVNQRPRSLRWPRKPAAHAARSDEAERKTELNGKICQNHACLHSHSS